MTESESTGRARSRERGRESKEILRARNALKGVRGILWLTAGGNMLSALFALASDGPGAGLWLSLGFGAYSIVGALTIFRFPRFWTVSTAVMQSLCAGLKYAAQGPYLFASVLAALLWTTVPLATRATAILKEWGAEDAADRLAGHHHTDAERSEARGRVERLRVKEAERTYLRLGLILAAIAAILVVGRFAYVRMTAPLEFEPSFVAWENAFELGEFGTAEAMCSDEYAPRWPKVVKILAREGWHPVGVKLRNARIAREGRTYREMHSPLPRGLMKTRWKLEGGAWRVDRVVFKDVKQGP